MSPFVSKSIQLLLACLCLTVSTVLGVTPPASDPVLDPADEVSFVPELMGEHPRLLFDATELTALKTAIQSPPLDAHYAKLLDYLGASQVPTSSNFPSNATEAQRQGFWRMPTVALHFALTGSTTSRDRSIAYLQWLFTYDHWETGGEEDSGMGAGNMMVGAAICYDLLYHELDTTFREQFRQKLLYHARAMYYGGHIGSQGGYWQVDPQNNHRWHRNAGLALCMLTLYEGNPEEKWMLRQLYDELAFVAEYLPDDGTSHESPTYLVFGGTHLALAMLASDRCFGTDYFDVPFFRNVGRFRAQSIAPGFQHFFMYGDSSDGIGNYGQFTMLATSHHGQADFQSAVDRLFLEKPDGFAYGWMGIVFRGTDQLGGDYHNLPLTDHFEDLGLTFMREGWESGDAAAMFICAPFGGHRLNDYRNANGFKYVNVAHDDPDANSFILFKDDEWVAETSRYSYSKKSHNHNTILVDGKGQRANGRAEGAQWSQPATGGTDMNLMAYTTWEEDNGDVVVTEGEAGGSYPEIDRFRRAFLWRTDRYVLVLDDIRSAAVREITWLMQSGSVATRDAAGLKFTLEKNSASCEFQVASTVALAAVKASSPADNRGNALGWEQLKLSANSDSLQIASAYDLWDKGNLTVTLNNVTASGAQVQVVGNGINDTWEWTFAPDVNTASSIALAASPTVSGGPSGAPIEVNDSATLTVARGGLGPVTYQWFQGPVGNTDHPVGGNSATLVTGALNGPTEFWVRISSAYGSVDSDAFLVELTSGFILWASESVVTGSRAENDDPDLDGLANLVEYALGMDPESGAFDMRRPAVEVSADTLHLNFSVPEAGLADMRYEVQVADEDLNGWTTVATKSASGEWTGSATVEQGVAVDGWIPISVPVAPLGGKAAITRLKVTRI